MKAFRRVFAYVWPQCSRLIVIVVCAMTIGMLFAFSVGTVLPLLKVMMGEEGLHGWVDRLISKNRYGISFYVPDRIDLSDPCNPDVAYHLRVTNVEERKAAADAGLEQDDLIVGAGTSLIRPGAVENMPSRKLLEELATVANNSQITVQFKRFNAEGQFELKELKLPTGRKPFYADFLQRVAGLVPR